MAKIAPFVQTEEFKRWFCSAKLMLHKRTEYAEEKRAEGDQQRKSLRSIPKPNRTFGKMRAEVVQIIDIATRRSEERLVAYP